MKKFIVNVDVTNKDLYNDIEYIDIYSAEDYEKDSEVVYPVVTMFKTASKSLHRSFTYNIEDRAYDYNFFGDFNPAYLHEAIQLYLLKINQKDDYSVFLFNADSFDNLMYEVKLNK